jgi:hypothetical protein
LFHEETVCIFQIHGTSKELKDQVKVDLKQEGHKLTVQGSVLDKDLANEILCHVEVSPEHLIDVLIALSTSTGIIPGFHKGGSRAFPKMGPC